MAEIFDFYVADNRTIKFNPIEPILQEDNGVAVWRFRIPKVLNNIDMSGFAWWFVYINAAKQKYSEPLTLAADTDDPDNYCIADYTIDYGISLTPGSFTFALEAINANGSGEIVEEWHTKTYSHSVIGTLQGNQAEYSETESDIISALMVQIQEKYNALVGGATPIPVASISAMTDTSKIYLLTTDNNWYCYNGSTWVSGGLYASGIVIDTTLTQAGQAADAGETGRKLTDLKSALEASTGFVEYSFTEDKFISTSGTTANINNPQDATGYRYTVAECVEGDVFTVSGRGSTVASLCTFIQSDGTIIEKSTTTALETDIEITAPANSAYLIVNSNRPAKCQKGTPVIDLVKALQTEQAETDAYIDAIKVFDQKGNIFEAKTDAYEGAYYYRTGTALTKGTNANYNCFIIPVTKNALYTFVTSNIVLLNSNKTPILTGGSWDYEATTQCNSGDAVYFAVSYRLSSVPTDGYAISEGGALDYEPYVGGYYAKTVSVIDKSTAKKVSGSISNGNNLTVSGKTAIKDGQQIVFKGKFSSFNEVDILFSGTGSTNAVKVDGTNLIITNNTNSTITEAHGLNIANEITILLELKQSHMYVSVTSMGITFKYNCGWNQTGGTITEQQAVANGMAFSDASLSVNYSAAKRDIWYFGDSYAQFGTDTRMPYYMVEYGYDENVLFNAVSGGTSGGAITALSTLVVYGSPSIAVIATGMNDGSDADATTPATNWINRVQQFISLCESNNIKPVLCTIPTVPTVNNEAKNAWVRSSGYRYIDYASAVGANASGQWYTGMLSSDNIHPSTLGGNALFTQLIADLPEVIG